MGGMHGGGRMRTREYKIETYEVFPICPECDAGDMHVIRADIVSGNKMVYLHKCNTCGYEGNYNEGYPKVVTKKVF